MMNEILDAFKCVFCGKWVTHDDAIPSFYENDATGATEYCDETQCVCVHCAAMHLDFNETLGDFQLKENRTCPEQARPANSPSKFAQQIVRKRLRITSELHPNYVATAKIHVTKQW